MKKSLLLLTIGALLACPILIHAQDSTPSGPPPGEHHGPPDLSFLTDAQKAEFEKARQEALAANPDLAKQEQDMKAAHDSGTPPDKEQMHAFREKMDAAMVAADPNVAPILQEIKEHMHHGHHGGGAGGPPPASTGTGGASGT